MSIARCRRVLTGVLILGLVLATLSPAAEARGGLQGVEKEFKKAIAKVSPATVICVPAGVEKGRQGSSSGVIISRDGYVLSDGDVGASYKVEGRRVTGTEYHDSVSVRVPDLERGGFATYPARVVKRVRGTDTTLLKIEEPPAGGFPDHLPLGRSTHLRVGDFTFVMGNAFKMAQEAPPTLTAGVVASLRPLPDSDGGGIEFIYTSAAVNPGVNGGPCIDVEGRLVGTVSTFLGAEPGEPFQFLGKVIPMARIRAAYADVAEARAVFDRPVDERRRAKASLALETVYRHVAHTSGPAVVSLEVKRSQPRQCAIPRQQRPGGPVVMAQIPRYAGSVSGVLLDDEGWIVTSLYNLTSTLELTMPHVQNLPAEVGLETGLRAIEGVTAHFLDGREAPAKVVGHDGRLGIALLKAELPAGGAWHTLEIVPAAEFATGRFVCALGNPFGEAGRRDPFLTVGLLSKQHALRSNHAWRGQWQTDAGVTDGNCGGALVDLRGRLLGILEIWNPTHHGRNSGIGFVAPAPDIVAVLPRLKEGRSLKRGRLGISFRQGATKPLLATVDEGSPAQAAGLKAGDLILAVDGVDTPSPSAFIRCLLYRWEGDVLEVKVERGRNELELEVRLGPKP